MLKMINDIKLPMYLMLLFHEFLVVLGHTIHALFIDALKLVKNNES